MHVLLRTWWLIIVCSKAACVVARAWLGSSGYHVGAGRPGVLVVGCPTYVWVIFRGSVVGSTPSGGVLAEPPRPHVSVQWLRSLMHVTLRSGTYSRLQATVQ